MKKPTAFMIAYIAILCAAPIVGLFTDATVITKIALAATISGIFLAIADLCNNLSKEWEQQIKISEKEIQEAEMLAKKVINTLDQLSQKAEKLIDRATTPEAKQRFVQLKKEAEQRKKTIQRKAFNPNGHIKFRSTPKFMSKFLHVIDLMVFFVGIGVFFLLVFFPDIIPLFEYRQEWFSTYGCAVVLVNYLVTDTAQIRISKRMKAYKESIAEFNKIKKKLDKAVKANEREVSTTKEISSTASINQEEQANGKIENAQSKQS